MRFDGVNGFGVFLRQRISLARPVRLERTAFGSGGQRSIQLSYGRLRLTITGSTCGAKPPHRS